MSWINFTIICLISQIFGLQAQSSKEPGIPFIRNYKAEEYKSYNQNWAITQDKRGIIYVGNGTSLLEFDGKYWRKVNLPSIAIVRSLDIDEYQTVYIGGKGEFGYLAFDNTGKSIYHSLVDRLPKEERHFKNVWTIHATSHGIYFFVIGKAFRFAEGTIEVVARGVGFVKSLEINNGLIVAKEKEGLGILKGNRLQILPHIKKIPLDSTGSIIIVPYINNKILIVTENIGMFTYDLSPLPKNGSFIPDFSTRDIPPSVLQKFPTDIDTFLKRYRPYHAIQINDNCYAFGSSRNGIAFMDQQGKLLRIINKKAGLNDNTVWYLYRDHHQNLWAALNNGISYIETNSPITQFNDKNGVEGISMAMLRHQGTVYLGHMSGVSYLPTYQKNTDKKPYGFLPLGNTSFPCWNFISVKDMLFAGGNHIIYQIQDTTARKKHIKQGIYHSIRSFKFPRHIFLGLVQGFAALKIDDSRHSQKQHSDSLSIKFIDHENFKKIKSTIYRIAVDVHGDLWLMTFHDGLIYLRFTGPNIYDFEIYHYNKSHGLIRDERNVVCFINNRLIVTNPAGIFQAVIPDDFSASPGKLRFIPEESFGKIFSKDSLRVNQIEVDNQQNLWISSNKGVIRLYKTPDDNYVWDDISLKKIKGLTSNFYLESSGRFWAPTRSGLYHFDANKSKNYRNDYHTMIRKVTIKKDSLLFYGNYGDSLRSSGKHFLTAILDQPQSWIPQLFYEHNSLTFEYTAAFYEHSHENRFQYKLEGFDNDWSEWTSETKKEYTNLLEGEYAFRVRAKNIFEHQGSEAIYRFSIFPPWYRAGFAYAGYGAMFLVFFYGVLKLNSRRLMAAKKRLENIVTERTEALKEKTKELQEKNEQITKSKDELRNRNEQITSSIRYASRIQQAILPLKERFASNLSQYFIIYRPKDIVSGDFYWFYKGLQTFIIAVIDCTGHGVSGAFMSMIGNVLLNDVVKELRQTDSAKILEYLHIGVRRTLQQEQNTFSAQDGMDVCLCVFDNQWRWMEFTGAKRPLYIFRNGKEDKKEAELIEIKGTRKSIGGRQKEDKRTFDKTRIEFQLGDSIYLTSDGLIDQANEKNKRFTSRRLKETLKKIGYLNSEAQEKALAKALDDFQGSAEQRDDITVIGIKI